MSAYLYNVAKVFILRQELYEKRSTSCPGCHDDQPNQLAHVTGIGTGCLDPFDEIPEDWFWEVYSSLPVRKVDDLFRKLICECLVIQETNGLEILVGNELMEVVMSTDISYYGQHMYELCEKLLPEEAQEDNTEITDAI